MSSATLSNGDAIEMRSPDASDFLFITTAAEKEKEPVLTYKALARLIIAWGEKSETSSSSQDWKLICNHEVIAGLGRRDVRALKQASEIFSDRGEVLGEVEAKELENGGLQITLSSGEILVLRDSTGKDERLAGEFATKRNAAGKSDRNDYRYILYLFGLLTGHEGHEGFIEFCRLVPFDDVMGLVRVYNDFF